MTKSLGASREGGEVGHHAGSAQHTTGTVVIGATGEDCEEGAREGACRIDELTGHEGTCVS